MRSFGHHGPYYGSSKAKNYWGKSTTFHWKCMECQNIQTGSECKGCRKKYWEVRWEKHEPGKHGRANGPSDQKAAHSDPHVALHQLIHTLLNPAVGAPAPDPSTVALATQLQKQLMLDASLSCKHQRLRSILDKIDYQKKEAQRKQEQVDYMKAQIETLEKELDNHTSQISALEEERTMLCESISEVEAADKCNITEEEQAHCDQHLHPTGRVPRQSPMGRHFSLREWDGDMLCLTPEQLQQLTEMTVRETARRAGFGAFGSLEPATNREQVNMPVDEGAALL